MIPSTKETIKQQKMKQSILELKILPIFSSRWNNTDFKCQEQCNCVEWLQTQDHLVNELLCELII